MLQTIKKLLLKIVDDIDAGNSNADEEELMQVAVIVTETFTPNKFLNYH